MIPPWIAVIILVCIFILPGPVLGSLAVCRRCGWLER